MQNERDFWNRTIFHRTISEKIGKALSAYYDVSEPLPDRILTLLTQLDEPSAKDAASASGKRGG